MVGSKRLNEYVLQSSVAKSAGRSRYVANKRNTFNHRSYPMAQGMNASLLSIPAASLLATSGTTNVTSDPLACSKERYTERIGPIISLPGISERGSVHWKGGALALRDSLATSAFEKDEPFSNAQTTRDPLVLEANHGSSEQHTESHEQVTSTGTAHGNSEQPRYSFEFNRLLSPRRVPRG